MTSPDQFKRDILDLVVDENTLAFWWLGQHSWIFKTSELVFGVDVWLKPDARRRIEPPLKPEQCDFFNYLLCTHEHSDHFDQYTLSRIAPLDAPTTFVVPEVVHRRANDIGIAEGRLVTTTGESAHDLHDLHVISIPAAHEFLEYDAATGFRFQGLIVHAGPFTIYHSGDTCCYDGLAERLRKCPADLMLLPINGRDGTRYRRGCIGNMTYQEAVDLAGATAPRYVCPAHHGVFTYNTGDDHAFADYLAAKYPDRKYILPEPAACNRIEKA